MRFLITNFAIFLFYSFLGWICETAFCSIAARKFINRGFLSGPFCPIYGFGAMMILLCFSHYQNDLAALFLFSMVGTSVLEYITSFLLEKLFHLSLWDYSGRKWNLNGRICLRNSLLFGIMSVLMIRIIHPYVIHILSLVPETALLIAFLVLAVYFLLDTGITIHALAEINREAGERQMELEGLAALRDQYLASAKKQRRRARIQRRQKLYRRLMQAFPRMRSLRNPETFRQLLNEAQDRVNQAASRIKQRKETK